MVEWILTPTKTFLTFTFPLLLFFKEYVRGAVIPPHITVIQGENAQLTCRASGVPKPTITWQRKDGSPMPLQHSVVMGVLLVKNIRKKEEGTFVCNATNTLGSKSFEAVVTVNGKGYEELLFLYVVCDYVLKNRSNLKRNQKSFFSLL